MALVAMSCFKSPQSFAQADKPKAFSAKIKTPDTSKELKNTKPTANPKVEENDDEADVDKASKKKSSSYSHTTGAAPRKLRQHGLGLGLGQTFLFGDYSKLGEDKITMDVLYTYAASYSFDILINAHMSEHEDKTEKMRVMGLTTSFKGRLVEFDNFSPYFLAGLGFYAPKARRELNSGREWTDQKITFGMNFGGGLDLRLNDNYVVGILGQMHWPFAVKQDVGPDLNGYYFKLLMTGMFLF